MALQMYYDWICTNVAMCVYITGSDISPTGAGGQYREAQRGPWTGPGKEGRQHVPNAIQEGKGVYKP